MLKSLFRTTNVHGALVTMPHKVTTTHLVDEMTTTAKIAGACNAILRRADGSLLGDMFDGAGFVRGVERKGKPNRGRPRPGGRLRRCRLCDRGIFGSGGVSAIGLFDPATASRRRWRPATAILSLATGLRRLNDPAGYDIVVNATPLGMKPGDPHASRYLQGRADHIRG